ncbi:MAG: acyl-CoA dehydrogenase [Acidimicrobiales bacterium]|nr:acyl-CoA dehydrogenase [Acidimicrobiales bacterium]
MELELGEYQELLRATTRAFLDKECPTATVRSMAETDRGFDLAYWKAGAELGWTSLLVDPVDGGGSVSGDGVGDLVLVAEEMGRAVAPGPLVPTNVVASALGAWADEDRRRSTLAALMGGDLVAAWADAEPPDAAPTRLEQGATAGSFVLTGTKSPVEAGAEAGQLLVSAVGDRGPVQVLVAADADGVTITRLGCLDLVRRFAEVRLDAVAVSAADVVGPPERTAAELARLRTLAVVLQCAETVGALDRIFGITLAMLGDRYSFGRPLASYQALKHRCADIKTALEACHATVTAAARALADGRPEAPGLASVAKAWIAPVATDIVQDCVQLHGGIGVTWDHDLHLYLRRVTVNRGTYGTPDDHLERIADHLLGATA